MVVIDMRRKSSLFIGFCMEYESWSCYEHVIQIHLKFVYIYIVHLTCRAILLALFIKFHQNGLFLNIR